MLKHLGVTNAGVILPSLSPADIKDHDKILSWDRNPYDFLPENTSFSPLLPKYYGDIVDNSEIKEVPDFCTWIERSPKGIMYPVSPRFKEILEKFNLTEHRFYDANVIIQDEMLPFNVFHVFPLRYYGNSLIDFNHSTFCNFHPGKKVKLGDEHVKASGFDELYAIRKERKWRSWGYNKAFVKPEFHNLDWIRTHTYGILISEELKNEIEAAGLTGAKITPCPIEFKVYQNEI